MLANLASLLPIALLAASGFTQVSADKLKACDKAAIKELKKDLKEFMKTGNAKAFIKKATAEETDSKVFYVKPGTGSCGITYTDADPVACIDKGWMAAAAKGSACNKWIEAEFPDYGTKVQVRALDTCGDHANPDNDFGCNDIYFSLSAYSALANGNTSLIAQGNLGGEVRWRFVNEPCFACEEGLPGLTPLGKNDTCTGPDSAGIMRNGRMTGKDIKTPEEAAQLCMSSGSSKNNFNVKSFLGEVSAAKQKLTATDSKATLDTAKNTADTTKDSATQQTTETTTDTTKAADGKRRLVSDDDEA